MYLAYYDEAGDDGFPGETRIFVLSCIYMHENTWKENFSVLREFRRNLKQKIGLGIRRELHVRDFLRNEKRYKYLKLSIPQRVEIVTDYCALVSSLKIRAVNLVINKNRIDNTRRTTPYPILETALNYSLNRVENDLKAIEKQTKTYLVLPKHLMVFTDPGREGKMRKTARKIQVTNPLRNLFSPERTYNAPLDRMLEDILIRDSRFSPFVQISDLIATIVFQYMKMQLGLPIAKDLRKSATRDNLVKWMNALGPVLNHDATRTNEYGYGIACYPKAP